jgi:Large polyvalent protein associated domain 38/ADP-Ribosyltransferase in polyvalent proteins
MDVRLPDGTLIRNVPEGTSKAELDAKLAASGYNVANLLQPAPVEQQPPQEAKTSNPLMGGLARILDLGGSAAEAVQRVSAPMRQQLEEATPESMRSKLLSDEAVRKRQEAFTSSTQKMSKDIGYEPSTTLGELGENPLKVVPFVIERVITSSPDMAGAALAFTPYVMTRANEILNERLKNDGKSYDQATVGDVTAATAGAIGEATLERFATKRILPGGKAVQGAPAAGLPAAAKRVGKEMGVQAGTESLEELSSYAGEALGTKKGFDPAEAGERMLEAGIVGGGLGGGVRGGREAYDYYNRPKIEELPPDAPIEPVPEVEQVKPVEEIRPEPVTGKEPWEEVADEILKKPPVEAAPVEETLVKPPIEPMPFIPIEENKKGSKIEGVEEIRIDPNELRLSEDVPQFKEDADVMGVVEPLKGEKYDYVGTPPIQVWRRLDGSLEIISGRHRWDLAKRTGAEYIPAQVFDEGKGFNADMAAIMDAELNIRDGKGKVTDYVNYFTEAGNRFGLTKKDYENRGLLDSSKGKRAYAITVQGSDDLIQSLRGRQVTEDTAYRIADAVPNDPRLQALGLKLVNEKPLEQAINILKAAKTIEPKTPEMGGEIDLFGFDDSGMKLAEDMGKLASEKQRSISEQIKAIEGPGKKSEIAKKYGINVEDPEAIKQKVKDLKAERAAWDNWASNPELVDQIRRELAGEVEPVAAEAKPEKAPSKKPAKKAAEKKEKVEEKPVEQDKLTKWFKNSVVAGKDGKPLRMYHATSQDFSVFDRMKSAEWRKFVSMDNIGSWFSDNPAATEKYASKEGINIVPVYLRIENPKVYTKFSDFINEMRAAAGLEPTKRAPGKVDPEPLRNKLKAEGYDGITFAKTNNGPIFDKLKDLQTQSAEAAATGNMAKSFRLEKEIKELRAQIDKQNTSTEFDDQQVWVAFEPDQIKSAIGSGYTEGVGDITASFRLEPEQKQTAAEKKAAAEREQKEIADREAEFFTLTPRTPEQGAGNYLQQDMIGAMGLTETEFKKGIDKNSTEPGEPLILRDVTMKEYDYYNDEANQKVDQESVDQYDNMDDVKNVEVKEDNVVDTLSRQAKAIEEYVDLASQGKVTADEFMKSVRAAAAKGDIQPDVLNTIEFIYKKYPAVLEGIRFEVVGGKKRTGKYLEIGHYQPLARMIRLFKDTSGVSDPSTVRHEIAHTMEQMMTPEQKRMVVRAWRDALVRATRADTTDAGQIFFANVAKFLHDPKIGTLKTAIKSMPNESYYQYINPSEYWAVNAEEILKSRAEGASSLRQTMEKLHEGLKQSFGMSNFWTGNKVFDQILTGDRFNNKMLLHYLRQTKMRNYLGEKAPLATWDSMESGWVENLKYKLVDKYIDLLRINQDVERMTGEIGENVDAYTKETLSHSRISTRIKDFMRDHVAKLAKVMRDNNISQQQLHEYLLARHAPEYNRVVGARNPEMGDNAAGITTAEAENYIRSLGKSRIDQLNKAAAEIDKMTQATRDTMVESGIETEDTIKAWESMFKFYAPMYRKDLEYTGGKAGVGKGFQVQGKSSKAAMGSTKEVADISESIIKDHIAAIERGERSRVSRALYGMAITHPNPSYWMPIDPRAIKDEKAARAKLEAIGVNPDDINKIMQTPKSGAIDPKTGLVHYTTNRTQLQSDNVLATRINGEDVYIVFNNSDPRARRLALAMKNMDLPPVEGLMKASAYVTRWFAMVNTQLNPIFGLWNFSRDVQGAMLNLSTTPLKGMETKILKDSMSNIFTIYKAIRQERATGEKATNPGSADWYDFQEQGGITGYKAQFVKPQVESKSLEDAITDMNRGNVRKIVGIAFNWISDYNDTLENAVRLGAYKAALEKGMSKQAAANIAKNLTVNFNRKGASSQTAGALYAFFNASVQGTSRLMQTMKGPIGKKILFGGMMLGLVQSFMMAAAGLEDDEPPEFVKEKNIIIPLGMLPGVDSKKYFSIPMPLGFNVIPGMGRLLGEAVIGAGKGRDVSGKFFDALSLLANSFNPLGSSGLSLQTILPTPLDPVAAISLNKDAFGRPIYKEDRATNPQVGYERTRENTHWFWKEMAQFINAISGGTEDTKGAWSPTGDEIAYLAGQVGGGAAREAGKVFGAATDFITGDEIPPYKIPLFGKLYGDAESKAAVKNRFYANVTKLAEVERTIAGKQKRQEDVGAYRREHPESQLVKVANRIENEITQLNQRRKKLIERGATIQQIKQIEDIKERKMRMLNERYDQLRK